MKVEHANKTELAKWKQNMQIKQKMQNASRKF